MFNLDLSQTVLNPTSPAKQRRLLLTQIGDSNDYLFVIDNSSTEKFETCHRASEYYSVWGRERAGTRAALTFGSAIHIGAELIHRGQSAAVAVDKTVSYLLNHPAPVDDHRTPAAAAEVITHYYDRQRQPDYTLEVLKDKSGNLLVEHPFEVPLGVIQFDTYLQLPQWKEEKYVQRIFVAWSGRIDLVAAIHGHNRILDHKTSSIDDENFIQGFQLASQTVGYVYAGNYLFPELNITSFCLNLIRFKKPTGTGSLVEPGPRGGKPALQFARYYFNYTPERLEEWRKNALTTVSDLLSNLRRGFFTQQTVSCMGKYGKCQYHEVCTTNEQNLRPAILASEMYKDVEWDPTHERE